MYIYNVTLSVEEEAHNEWVRWMKAIHIPDMLATGKFSCALMVRVMTEAEPGSITYAVQYITDSKVTLERYYKEDAERLREDGMKRFAGKFVAFRTELEVIGEYRPVEGARYPT